MKTKSVDKRIKEMQKKLGVLVPKNREEEFARDYYAAGYNHGWRARGRKK